MESWDLIIIGAGPAGMAAGIYGTRSGISTLVLEEKMAGGTASDAPLIENYPGFPSISGSDLVQKIVAHSRGAGVIIREFESATNLDFRGEMKIVKTDKATYEAKAVVFTSGTHYREVGVPGEKEFRGRGVSYCGLCDGPLFKGKLLLVVGGGNSALITALYLAGLAAEVKLAHRRSAFRAEEALVKALSAKQNVEILLNSEVREIKGERFVNKVVVRDLKTGVDKEIAVDGVFVQVGESPNSQVAREAGVAVNADGYIIVDIRQQTNVAGVFAAGDVSNHPVKQIGSAVGQGITAAVEVYSYVRKPYYHRG